MFRLSFTCCSWSVPVKRVRVGDGSETSPHFFLVSLLRNKQINAHYKQTVRPPADTASVSSTRPPLSQERSINISPDHWGPSRGSALTFCRRALFLTCISSIRSSILSRVGACSLRRAMPSNCPSVSAAHAARAVSSSRSSSSASLSCSALPAACGGKHTHDTKFKLYSIARPISPLPWEVLATRSAAHRLRQPDPRRGADPRPGLTDLLK